MGEGVEGECPFCRELEHSRSRIESEAPASYFFWEGEDVFVVADIAPIVAGHILIVSKHHRTNFWKDWRDADSELHRIIGILRRFSVSHLQKSVVAFEHGVTTSLADGRGACIDHAHVHLAPIKGPLLPEARKAGAWQVEFPGRDHEDHVAQCYVLSDTDGGEYALATEHFESQFFRFVLAQHAGSNFWDWKDFMDFQDASGARATYAATVAILRRALSNQES